MLPQKYKKLALILTAGMSLSIGACSSGSSSSTPNTTPTTPAKDDLFLLQMGSGYDSTSGTATSNQSCLQAAQGESNIMIANPSATVTFDQNSSLSQFENTLGINMSGKFAAGLFSGSGAAQFLQASQGNGYSYNIYYMYQYSGTATFAPGSVGQGTSSLTPTAQSFVTSNNQQAFQEMCGDHYVSQMNAGVTLLVKLTLTFNSSIEQSKFAAQLSGSMGMASITAAIQDAATNSNVHSEFSISAMQLGGQPQDLNNLFGTPTTTGNYAYVDCGNVSNTAGVPQACNTMIDNIITYAQSLESQVSNSNGALNLNNLYYTDAVLSPYNSLGIQPVIPESSVIQAAATLSGMYESALYQYNLVTHYLNSSITPYLEMSTSMSLQDLQSRLANQIQNVYQNPVYNVMSCYKGFVESSCIITLQNVQTGLQQYQDQVYWPAEQSLINYLDTNSYTAMLVDTNGSQSPVYTYQKCAIVPSSYPDSACATDGDPYANQFVVNCDGYWMNGLSGNPATNSTITLCQTTNPITTAVTGITLNNLNYNTTGPIPESYGQMMSYLYQGESSNISVPASTFIPGQFELQGVTVQGSPSNPPSPTYNLEMFQAAHSQS